MKPQTVVSLLWFNWLLLVVLGVMAAGIAMVVAPELIRRAFSLMLYGTADAVDSSFGGPAIEYVTLVHGVLGSVMFGWAVALLLILLGPFRRGSREGWLMLVASLAAWFIPDTLFSLWAGFWQNAVLNAVSAVLFAIPLAATFNVFFGERA